MIIQSLKESGVFSNAILLSSQNDRVSMEDELSNSTKVEKYGVSNSTTKIGGGELRSQAQSSSRRRILKASDDEQMAAPPLSLPSPGGDSDHFSVI